MQLLIANLFIQIVPSFLKNENNKRHHRKLLSQYGGRKEILGT